MDYQFGTHAVRITSRIAPLIIDGRFHGAVGIDLSAPQPLKPGASSQKQRATTSPLLESKLSVLSPREREVVHWLGQGKSNDEIATILGISSHTVKNHVDHIFQKLGVHNRYEAILATT
jgi:DNA-binding CsgD family transcriptional regulator